MGSFALNVEPSLQLELKAPEMKIVDFADSVDPDEAAQCFVLLSLNSQYDALVHLVLLV